MLSFLPLLVFLAPNTIRQHSITGQHTLHHSPFYNVYFRHTLHQSPFCSRGPIPCRAAFTAVSRGDVFNAAYSLHQCTYSVNFQQSMLPIYCFTLLSSNINIQEHKSCLCSCLCSCSSKKDCPLIQLLTYEWPMFLTVSAYKLILCKSSTQVIQPTATALCV